MEENKYRVWDTEFKRMIDPTILSETGAPPTCNRVFLGSNGLMYQFLAEPQSTDKLYDSTDEGIMKCHMIQTKRFIPLFYTRHNDKNDKEIYDGDILRTYDSQRDLLTINQVFWRNDLASWHLKSDKWFDIPLTFSREDVEIIGNKYEDKHLSEKLKSDHEINGNQ